MQNPSLFIAIPCGTLVHTDFVMSLLSLVTSLHKPLKGGGHIGRFTVHVAQGSILPKQRHQLVLQAREQQYSHILFLDSDMAFPAFTAHQLFAAGKQVVAANCAVKKLPSVATARRDTGDGIGEVVFTTEETKGLEQVWRVGTGVMLISTSVFDELPIPWFDMVWSEQTGDYVGEDWRLCEKLQAAGIPIFIDHLLSQHIGHIGSYTYTHDDVEVKENKT